MADHQRRMLIHQVIGSANGARGIALIIAEGKTKLPAKQAARSVYVLDRHRDAFAFLFAEERKFATHRAGDADDDLVAVDAVLDRCRTTGKA